MGGALCMLVGVVGGCVGSGSHAFRKPRISRALGANRDLSLEALANPSCRNFGTQNLVVPHFLLVRDVTLMRLLF